MRFKFVFILSLACVALVAGASSESHDVESHVESHVESEAPSASKGNETFPWPWKTTTTTSTTPPPSPPTPSPTPPPTTSTTSTTAAPPTPPPSPPTPPPTPPPTTTTPRPTPTPAPSPAPKLDNGNWTVRGENITCIYLQTTLSAKIQYPLINKGVGLKTVDIPNNATASGTCGNTSDVLTLSWEKHHAEFTFSKIANSTQYDLANVTLSFTADNNTFPNVSTEISSLEYRSSAPLFVTSLSFSYQCSVQKTVPLLNGTAPNGTEILGSLAFNKLHLQAFSENHLARFGSPEDCDEDASDMVPIVVGCCLAGLVVIILGVYMWGRRSQNRGYLSM